MVSSNEIIQALKPVADALEQLGIPYYIGGSVASSSYGIARSTLDVDLVSNLKTQDIPQFVSALRDCYYVNEASITDAIRHSASFNLIHLNTGLKIDIFIQKNRPYDQTAASRRRPDSISVEGNSPTFYLAAPEDVILAKLEWYKMGGQVSHKQWSDILGVLRIQNNHLDLIYLRKWSDELKLGELFDKAWAEKNL